MNKNDKILILGGTGLVGSALVREFKRQNFNNILSPGREELDATDQKQVADYFTKEKPRTVICAAAKVGGIYANSNYPADFIFNNLLIQGSVFKACFEFNVEKFLFLGSSCIYPKNCPQPIKEEYLLQSPLEPTNEPYAIAKIAGLKLAESFKKQYNKNFFSVMPTNLYGENDNFHPQNGHVIPCLINRLYKVMEKKEDKFVVWGTGNPLRDLLYVDDLAKACIFLLDLKEENPYHWINIGTGTDCSIKELAETIANVMGFKGKIVFDNSYPDGTFRKCLDVSKINAMGWKYETPLKKGIEKTVNFFLKSKRIESNLSENTL
ncbi:GDP-L-fucose synthase [Bacteriovoracales bacterium]|nr:GDP-L-fucose synthase [Bacteriovoracales bacterium]